MPFIKNAQERHHHPNRDQKTETGNQKPRHQKSESRYRAQRNASFLASGLLVSAFWLLSSECLNNDSPQNKPIPKLELASYQYPSFTLSNISRPHAPASANSSSSILEIQKPEVRNRKSESQYRAQRDASFLASVFWFLTSVWWS
jgi:hypothetical protein